MFARVLVVGINYAPEQTGVAPYTTQACEHLARLGADVRVLAGMPHHGQHRVPTGYRLRPHVDERRRGGVRVRRLRHHVPDGESALRQGAYEASFGAQVRRQRFGADEVVERPAPRVLHDAADLRQPWVCGVPPDELVVCTRDEQARGLG